MRSVVIENTLPSTSTPITVPLCGERRMNPRIFKKPRIRNDDDVALASERSDRGVIFFRYHGRTEYRDLFILFRVRLPISRITSFIASYLDWFVPLKPRRFQRNCISFASESRFEGYIGISTSRPLACIRISQSSRSFRIARCACNMLDCLIAKITRDPRMRDPFRET